MPQPSLDIVLPCYNPRDGWAEAVIHSHSKICNVLAKTKVRLIIVNDGSTKDLHADWNLLKEKIPPLIIESYPVNRGKGYAVRKGVERAAGDVIIYTDIDFPYEESGLAAVYESISKGNHDVALGVRDESYYRQLPAARKLISGMLQRLIRTLLNIPTSDTQAGLKGFNKKGKEIFLRTTIDRYLFDLEFIQLTARQKDLRIGLVPVTVKPDLHFTSMSWNVLFREAFNFMRILFPSSR